MRRRGWRLWALTVASWTVLAGCGTGAAVTVSPSVQATGGAQAAGTVRLADDGCQLETSVAVPAGEGFTIEAVNATESDSGFDLYLLRPDSTYEDWVAFNAAAQESLEDGSDPAGSPADLASPIDLQVAVPAGGMDVLSAPGGDAGTYALQCWIFPASGTARLMSAGPLTVPSD